MNKVYCIHYLLMLLWRRKNTSKEHRKNLKALFAQAGVEHIPYKFYRPYISKNTQPSWRDAEELCGFILLRTRNSEEDEHVLDFPSIPPNVEMTIDQVKELYRPYIEESIAFLKNQGYVIFKKI